MRMIVTAAIMTAALSAPASAASFAICVVADPTGTPLNIRMQPNGEVVATVRNGETIQVFLENATTDSRGRIWHYVAKRTSSAPDGYVLAAYLRCP